MQRHAHGLGLTALRFIGEIVGPAHRALDRLARRCFHDDLLDPWNRLAVAEHDRDVALLADVAVLVRDCERRAHHVAFDRLLIDRRPSGAFVAQPIELLLKLLVADRSASLLHAEAVGARELDGGSHLEVELEGERCAILEFEIVDVRL